MKGVILSAGLGTRLRPLTENCAKPAVPFFTLPMLAFSHYALKQAGVNEFFINTHHCPDTIKQAVNHIKQPGDQFHFNHEPEILGSGGALLGFKEHLCEDFFISNGDSVFILNNPNDIKTLFKVHRQQNNFATIAVMPHQEAGKSLSACWIDDDSYVVGFGKNPPSDKCKPMHYFGLQVLSHELMQKLPEGESNILLDVILPELAHKNVKAMTFDDVFWHETGNQKDYLEATEIMITEVKNNTATGVEMLKVLKQYYPGFLLELNPFRLSHPENLISNEVSISGYSLFAKGTQITGSGKIKNIVTQNETHFDVSGDINNTVLLKS